MIRIISSALCLIAMLGLSSCAMQEEPMPDNEVESTVTFSVQINPCNTNETETRSLAPGYRFGDGTSVNTVKCYVYNKAMGVSSEPVKTIDIPVANLNSFTIKVPRKQTFDFVFLATSIPQNDASSKLYYSTTERSLEVNYGSIYCNDEELDCFFAVVKNFSSETSSGSTVVLQRPFAQLNVGAKDFSSYNSSNPIASVAVTIDGVYNKVNLMDGSLVGTPATVSFIAAAPPTDKTFPKTGSSYLAMNYLLVNTRSLSTLNVVVNHRNGAEPRNMTFTKIAIERNYQTNVSIKSLFPPMYN